ncbi:unnamed protein product [marine sediment metagenome]|uniref:Recombinase domain-containing protein n=1 Tax=marine sediment metagenome TaxID=412755 RepID=X0ZM61_9ZZZZ
MKVVLYARVSSERQAEKDLSISAQLKAMRKYSLEHNFDVYKEFVDEAESARTANRPAFQNMIAFAKQKPKLFDSILVWKLSRFARNREDSIIYKALLRRRGISVISINEKLDDSPSGKLLEGMIEVIDEFYSTNLAQDTLRGMKENVSRGFRNGSTIPMGYKKKIVKLNSISKTTLDIDDNYAPIIKRIFQMCNEGMGAKEIVKALNSESIKTNRGKSWTKNIVYYILKNETYTGTLVWNKTSKSQGRKIANDPEKVLRIKNNHPSIIDKKTFNKVQKLLQKRSPKVTHPRTISSNYLLSGILFCGKCNVKMVGCSAKSSTAFYYACQNHRNRGNDICNVKPINKEKIEGFIVDRIKINILTEKNLKELVMLSNEETKTGKEQYNQDIEMIDKQLDGFTKRLSKLYDILETRELDLKDLAPRIKKLKSLIDDLLEKRSELNKNIQGSKMEIFNISKINSYVKDLKTLLSKGTIIEQKSFIHSFIKRIELNKNKITVIYTIPLELKKAEPLNKEVLPFDCLGSPGWCLKTC